MRLYPQGLRSVILNSVVPPQDNFVAGLVNTDARSLKLIFDTCAAQPACSQAYPNLDQTFYQLVDRLNQNPIHITLTDSNTNKVYPALINGDSFVSALFFSLYVTDFIPLIPQIIDEVNNGNYSFLERILSQIVFDFSISDGMYYSVNCADYQNETPPAQNPVALPPELEKIRKDSIESFVDICKLWDVPPLNPQADQPVNSDIPTLVLAGSYDPATPPTNGEQVAKTLNKSYLFLFPKGAHGEALGNPCGDSLVEQFINNPNQKPDASCIGDQPPQFSTPAAIVRLPKLLGILNLQGSSAVELIVFGIALLILLTAILIYPLVWFIGLFRRKPQPVEDDNYPISSPGAAMSYPAAPPPAGQVQQRRPAAWRLAPWLAVLTALILAAFTVLLVVVLFGLIANNNSRLLLGLPGTTRPLFILTILAAVAAVVMLVLGIASWLRRWGGAWGRLYFSLLTLSALACVIILGIWGMLTAVIA